MTFAKRIESHRHTCTATTPAAMATHSATPPPRSPARCTKTIVATIAPGPASSGVPSGTSATLTPLLPDGCGSSIFPVSSSIATRSSSRPPAVWSAGSEMCM